MIVSVVIPALNEAKYIGRLLEDLVRQDRDDLEVIVVDSGSTDNTADVAAAYGDRLQLKVVPLDIRGVSLARNSGAEAARGDFLLFLDADLSIPPHAVSAFVNARECLGSNYILSANLKAEGSHPVDRFYMWAWSTYFRLLTRLGEPRLSGGCIFIRRSAHEALGGFDIGLEPSEDTDYALRAKKMGMRFAFVNELTLIHSSRRFVTDGRLRYATVGVITEIRKLVGSEKASAYRFGHYDDESGDD